MKKAKAKLKCIFQGRNGGKTKKKHEAKIKCIFWGKGKKRKNTEAKVKWIFGKKLNEKSEKRETKNEEQLICILGGNLKNENNEANKN